MAVITGYVGASTFLSLRGPIDVLGEVVEEVRRSGVDGHAYKKRGRRANATELRSISGAVSANAVEAAVDTYKGLQGTLCAVVLTTGTNFSAAVMVEEFIHDRTQAITGYAGPALGFTPAFLIFGRWRIRARS